MKKRRRKNNKAYVHFDIETGGLCSDLHGLVESEASKRGKELIERFKETYKIDYMNDILKTEANKRLVQYINNQINDFFKSYKLEYSEPTVERIFIDKLKEYINKH